MAQPDIIQTILKDSNYHLDLFNTSEIQDLREKVKGICGESKIMKTAQILTLRV